MYLGAWEFSFVNTQCKPTGMQEVIYVYASPTPSLQPRTINMEHVIHSLEFGDDQLVNEDMLCVIQKNFTWLI